MALNLTAGDSSLVPFLTYPCELASKVDLESDSSELSSYPEICQESTRICPAKSAENSTNTFMDDVLKAVANDHK